MGLKKVSQRSKEIYENFFFRRWRRRTMTYHFWWLSRRRKGFKFTHAFSHTHTNAHTYTQMFLQSNTQTDRNVFLFTRNLLLPTIFNKNSKQTFNLDQFLQTFCYSETRLWRTARDRPCIFVLTNFHFNSSIICWIWQAILLPSILHNSWPSANFFSEGGGGQGPPYSQWINFVIELPDIRPPLQRWNWNNTCNTVRKKATS